jgi:hypothetical protein
MTEARIECLCPSFYLSDLNLALRKGDIVWVLEETARSSEDLRFAVRSGAASVVYARRCSVSRSPPPPNVRMNRSQRNGFVRISGIQSERPETPILVPQGVDAKALEEAIANGVAKAIQGLVASGAFGPSIGAPVVNNTPVVVSSDPVYIPSNLVPASDTTITIAKSSSEGADLEAASAALKATRKRKTPSTETP